MAAAAVAAAVVVVAAVIVAAAAVSGAVVVEAIVVAATMTGAVVVTAAVAAVVVEAVVVTAAVVVLHTPRTGAARVVRVLGREWYVPIFMLRAGGVDTDRVVGLALGAVDDVVKPFSALEVVARIRAVLRRSGGREEEDAPGGPLEVAELRLDPARRSAALAGAELDLPRREFELLELLMRESGSVVTRERLIDEVWDVNWFGSTKTLDVHVSSLRRKLGEDSAEPRFIHTVRGVGFRLAGADEL